MAPLQSAIVGPMSETREGLAPYRQCNCVVRHGSSVDAIRFGCQDSAEVDRKELVNTLHRNPASSHNLHPLVHDSLLQHCVYIPSRESPPAYGRHICPALRRIIHASNRLGRSSSPGELNEYRPYHRGDRSTAPNREHLPTQPENHGPKSTHLNSQPHANRECERARSLSFPAIGHCWEATSRDGHPRHNRTDEATPSAPHSRVPQATVLHRAPSHPASRTRARRQCSVVQETRAHEHRPHTGAALPKAQSRGISTRDDPARHQSRSGDSRISHRHAGRSQAQWAVQYARVDSGVSPASLP